MLKAQASTAGGRPLVILGLSADNMRLLMEGHPIRVDLTELGLPVGEAIIVGGETEQAIAKELERAGLFPPGSAERIGQPGPGESRTFRPEEG